LYLLEEVDLAINPEVEFRNVLAADVVVLGESTPVVVFSK